MTTTEEPVQVIALLSGLPACGKTTLLKKIIESREDLADSEKNPLFTFFISFDEVTKFLSQPVVVQSSKKSKSKETKPQQEIQLTEKQMIANWKKTREIIMEIVDFFTNFFERLNNKVSDLNPDHLLAEEHFKKESKDLICNEFEAFFGSVQKQAEKKKIKDIFDKFFLNQFLDPKFLQNSSKTFKTFYFLDDNFFLDSMRKEYLQIAKKNEICFSVLYLKQEYNKCVEFNSKRGNSEKVEAKSMEKMIQHFKDLENLINNDPETKIFTFLLDATTNDFEILQKQLVRDLKTVFYEKKLIMKDLEAEKELERAKERAKTAKSLLHQFDLKTRKIVSSRIKVLTSISKKSPNSFNLKQETISEIMEMRNSYFQEVSNCLNQYNSFNNSEIDQSIGLEQWISAKSYDFMDKLDQFLIERGIIRHFFVYGTLRIDDTSNAPWTKPFQSIPDEWFDEIIEDDSKEHEDQLLNDFESFKFKQNHSFTEIQSKLYWKEYPYILTTSSLILNDQEQQTTNGSDANNTLFGCVQTVEPWNSEIFMKQFDRANEIEEYPMWYIREIVEAKVVPDGVQDVKALVNGKTQLQIVPGFIYSKQTYKEDSAIIESGDWMDRDFCVKTEAEICKQEKQ